MRWLALAWLGLLATTAAGAGDVTLGSLTEEAVHVELPGQRMEGAPVVSREDVHKLFPGTKAKIFIHYMPWWGKQGHIRIGLDEHDSKLLAEQVDAMIARGFDGVIVSESHSGDFNTTTTHRLFAEVEKRKGFGFAVMYNHGGLSDTAGLAVSLRRDQEDYFRSEHYLRWQGRPVVFFFDRPEEIDFAAAKRAVSPAPVFVFRNPGGFQVAASDGAFAWMADQSETADAYFQRFSAAAAQQRAKLQVAAVYKGFDDQLASWGKGRRIPARCGKTLLESVRRVSRDADLIQFNTWNDYEEGTDLEQGIDPCVQVAVGREGNKLQIRLDPLGEAGLDGLDHVSLYVTEDGVNAHAVKELAPRSQSLDLATLRFGPRARIFVVVVGKPLFRNLVAGPIDAGP